MAYRIFPILFLFFSLSYGYDYTRIFPKNVVSCTFLNHPENEDFGPYNLKEFFCSLKNGNSALLHIIVVKSSNKAASVRIQEINKEGYEEDSWLVGDLGSYSNHMTKYMLLGTDGVDLGTIKVNPNLYLDKLTKF